MEDQEVYRESTYQEKADHLAKKEILGEGTHFCLWLLKKVQPSMTEEQIIDQLGELLNEYEVSEDQDFIKYFPNSPNWSEEEK